MAIRERAGPRVSLSLDTSRGASTADAKGADINLIVAQYKKSGTLPRVAMSNPLYGDFTFPEDLHLMREAVERAEDRFMDLPADVRAAADNDWVEFMRMFDDPSRRPVLEAAGLILDSSPAVVSAAFAASDSGSVSDSSVSSDSGSADSSASGGSSDSSAAPA